MEFKFGELPDDHVFLFSVRPLVDWSFKLITWLGITATFQVAAELTGSPYLWAICVSAYLLVLLFLQSFIDWLFQLKLSRRAPEGSPAVAATAGRFRRWFRKARVQITVVLSFVILWSLVGMTQVVVNQAVSAIIEFQKKGTR